MSGLHHLALRVAEPTASARFYVEVLGLRELQVHRDEDGTARSVWLALGEEVLMLERSLRPPGANESSAHVLVLACAGFAWVVEHRERTERHDGRERGGA